MSKTQEASGMEIIEELVEELVEIPAEGPVEKALEKPVKEPTKTKAAEQPIKIYTVPKPKKVAQIICPFCKEQRKARGIKSHIELKHNIPGISVQELSEVSEGLRTLEDLVEEKFKDDDKPFMTNVLSEVLKKDFPSWGVKKDPEENLEEEDLSEEGPAEEDPEEGLEQEAPEEIKEELEERRKLNLYPPFSPFDRRKR
jgi:hypothetical protein